MAYSDTRRYSLAGLCAMRDRGEILTDLNALDREVDAAFWDAAKLVRPELQPIAARTQPSRKERQLSGILRHCTLYTGVPAHAIR
jgi:hypothetical protein